MFRITFFKNYQGYNPGQNISDKLKFFCELAPYGKSSISIFQEFFTCIDKIFNFGSGTERQAIFL